MLKKTPKMLLFPALALALVLGGCTSTGSADPGGNSSTVIESHLTKILKTKILKIAVLPDAPPWGIINASGEYEGLDVNLAKALAESLGAELEFVNTNDANRIPLLQTDKVDAVMAALTATNVRAQSVEMSRPYAAGGSLVLVPADSSIKSYTDLAGKNVAVSRGSSQQTMMEADFPDTTLTPFDTVADAIQALKSGKVDAMPTDGSVAKGLAADDSGLRVLDGPGLAVSVVSVGVKPGDQLWLNYLNTFIKNYNTSNAGNASYLKWLGEDIPAIVQ